MADLKIKVGASVDRSLSVAFQPLIEAANKAAAAIAAAGLRGGRAAGAGAKQGTEEAVKGYDRAAAAANRAAAVEARAAERAANAETRARDKSARDQIRAGERVSRARERENDKIVRDTERSERAVTNAAERASAARTRAAERELKAAARQNARETNRYGGYAIGAAKRVVGAGLGMARTFAGGMGVDLDVGSLVTKGTALEKNAVDLTNAGFMPGKAGPNGQRQNAGALVSQVRDIAIRTGTESGAAMEGLQAFVAKTGDLETGRNILFDISKLSKASGADIKDMADAAGDVANALGDVPNKGAAVQSVMQAIAAQGKEGAVEIKDLASQMAKLGAASSQFTGTSAESMAAMGALVQMTRAKGGAASSTQAATSVGAFVNTFSKGARRAAFDAAGVKVEANDGKLRSAKDIIVDALRATKGDSLSMGKMFADVAARRVTRGYETTYKEAGGGEAGIRAVERAFEDSARAMMLQTEIEESFGRAMQTSDSKAKIFNEQLGKVTMEMQAAFLPALQAAAPVLLSLAGSAANWLARVTGAEEKRKRSEEVGVEFRAINAAGRLKEGLTTGRIAEGETEQATKMKAELAAAIEAKKKQITEEGHDVGRGEGAFAPVKAFGRMTNEELSYAANVRGDESAAAFQRDKEQLERMQDTLSTLDTSLQTAMQRALEGSVITVRLNDPLQIATPSITTPNAGREAPPGAVR